MRAPLYVGLEFDSSVLENSDPAVEISSMAKISSVGSKFLSLEVAEILVIAAKIIRISL